MDNFINELAEALELDDSSALGPDVRLEDIEEWDSLSRLEFLALADMTYDKYLTGDDLEKCETVKDLYELVK
jgi:acyl carrier protein